MRWSLLRNHHCLKIFRTSNTEGPSSSSTPFEGGWTGPGAGGERGVIFTFLLGRAKTGGGNTSSRHRDDGGKKARSDKSLHSSIDNFLIAAARFFLE